MVPPRVIIGMMMHETNTFSAVKTTLKDFDPRYDQELVRAYKGTRSGIGGFIDVLERHGAEIIPTIGASATPSGPLRNKDYRTIVNTMIKVITESGRRRWSPTSPSWSHDR